MWFLNSSLSGWCWRTRHCLPGVQLSDRCLLHPLVRSIPAHWTNLLCWILSCNRNHSVRSSSVFVSVKLMMERFTRLLSRAGGSWWGVVRASFLSPPCEVGGQTKLICWLCWCDRATCSGRTNRGGRSVLVQSNTDKQRFCLHINLNSVLRQLSAVLLQSVHGTCTGARAFVLTTKAAAKCQQTSSTFRLQRS